MEADEGQGVTPHRLPLDPDKHRWPFPAWDFYRERVAILATEPDIREPEKHAESITRRWWATGAGEMPQDW
jgi:hypothetical protein